MVARAERDKAATELALAPRRGKSARAGARRWIITALLARDLEPC
jgi:hypothetical protein